MAESGALFGGDGDLPAGIENQFLKNIIEFEKASAEAKPTSVFEILGRPVFGEEENMNRDQFEVEYTKLKQLLVESGIKIDFMREREDRFKYNFITKELFPYETTFVPVKGMESCFIYEEFYPDHEMDLTDSTANFLNDFLTRKLEADAFYFSNEILERDGKTISPAELFKRFQLMYEATATFENTSFSIDNHHYDLKEIEGEESGMAFTEGTIQYDIIFKNGERKMINGPFKVYFSRQWGSWYIYFFFLAGFNLQPSDE